jgi:hypothetical protein
VQKFGIVAGGGNHRYETLQEQGLLDADALRSSFGSDVASFEATVLKISRNLEVLMQAHAGRTRFLEELLRPGSLIFSEFFNNLGQMEAPHSDLFFTDEQLMALCFLCRPERTATVASVVGWAKRAFPFQSTRMDQGKASLDSVVEAFFAEQLRMADGLFEPVNPATVRGVIGRRDHISNIAWRLRPWAENFIFEQKYGKEEVHFWRYTRPYKDSQSIERQSGTPTLAMMPIELKYQILGYFVKADGPLYPVKNTLSGRYQYWVRRPDWAGTRSIGSTALPLHLGVGWNLFSPLPLTFNTSWNQVVWQTFFHDNEMVIKRIPTTENRNRIGATQFTYRWLRSLNPLALKAIYDIEIPLDIKYGPCVNVEGISRYLGRSECLSKLTLNVRRVKSHPWDTVPSINDFDCMDLFRRFRGLSKVNFVLNEPLVGVDAWKRRMKQDKPPKPISQRALQVEPSVVWLWGKNLRSRAEAYGKDKGQSEGRGELERWILQQEGK